MASRSAGLLVSRLTGSPLTEWAEFLASSPNSKEVPAYLLLLTPEAGFPCFLLYVAVSEGEHSISIMSKPGACNRKGNLSRATQGFVYILGSSIAIVISRWSRSTRWYRSSTGIASLGGRPTLSSQVLSSTPTVWATNV